ncbi:glycerol-3-phosphate 1-O-acyltransferase PlsY [Mucilaginibacter ginsenosidivorans]|uniref:Glycerol-3-phosphate acyltransferase n=1 Tax=Mucilaginibacter ginsenosidivorans TaxID=398053 RepID=A0A5B8V2G3_9SPHI|nr:glycerol-3-phosphate 1-O-acyltransferase PlsY [Mucilaginibacter ginsenosidivorans]QEC64993.1 glycerol-3-phosphate 1-O-acyltransferase PlsY [Mucilaginibacter ginsenosidivorans]
MITVGSVSLLILAYLLGSIPTAVWIGKAFYGIDVREYGSGNAGATNTFRVLGKRAGIPVMLIDILKGFTATKLAVFVGVSVTGGPHSNLINYQLAMGMAAVMGHLFPVFAGFRGGKGIATLFGMVLAVNLNAALLCVIMFIAVLLITRYVSLSSITGGFTYLVGVSLIYNKNTNNMVVIFGMCICLLILVTHQKNIERLLKGTESKVNLFKRKDA